MPKLTFTTAAERTLTCLECGRRADRCRLRRALEHLAADPRHPGLHSHRYAVLPGHEHTTAWTSYVDQGAGCWRLFWTYEHPDGDDQAMVTVLQIGPHR